MSAPPGQCSTVHIAIMWKHPTCLSMGEWLRRYEIHVCTYTVQCINKGGKIYSISFGFKLQNSTDSDGQGALGVMYEEQTTASLYNSEKSLLLTVEFDPAQSGVHVDPSHAMWVGAEFHPKQARALCQPPRRLVRNLTFVKRDTHGFLRTPQIVLTDCKGHTSSVG